MHMEDMLIDVERPYGRRKDDHNYNDRRQGDRRQGERRQETRRQCIRRETLTLLTGSFYSTDGAGYGKDQNELFQEVHQQGALGIYRKNKS